MTISIRVRRKQCTATDSALHFAVSQLTNAISFEKKFISRANNESLAEPLNAAEGDTENILNYVTADPLSIAQSVSILADEMQTAIESRYAK